MRILSKAKIYLFLVFCLIHPNKPEAGRRAFIWTWDTENLKQGDVEIEQWLWWVGHKTNPSGWIWFSPIFGITDRIEIAFPWEIQSNNLGTKLTNFTAESRIRIGDLEDTNFFHHSIRLYYQQNMIHPYNRTRYNVPWFGTNYIMSFGNVSKAHTTIDLGIYSDLENNAQRALTIQTLGAGYTTPIHKNMRVGLEYFHEIGLSSSYKNFKHYFLGPNFSYSKGNVWITLGALKGLSSDTPNFMQRLILSIAL